MNFFYYKTIYTFYYLLILLVQRLRKKQMNNSNISQNFIKWNNTRVLKLISSQKIKLEEIAILLPHCIQNYHCPYKITNDIANCKECDLCKISNIKKIKDKYKLQVKVANGGTLARMFLKETKPKLVIAVACERDLVSGIYDTFPLMCYGIFNIIKNGPCISTDLMVEEVENALKIITNKIK